MFLILCIPYVKNRLGQILLPQPKFKKLTILVTTILYALTSLLIPASIQLAFQLFFFTGLIGLALIDLQTHTLPNRLTLPLILIGLFASFAGFTIPIKDALTGAAVGYLGFYLVGLMYQTLTRRMGIGYGDMKLAAVLGSWMGWQSLPHIILFGSVAAAITGIVLLVFKMRKAHQYLPFGPYLVFFAIVIQLARLATPT